MVRLKKAIIIPVVALSMTIGGMAMASIYHITDAKDALQEEYKVRAESFKSEMEQKIKADTMNITQSEIDRMRYETEERFNKVAGQYYQDKLNEKSQAIEAETDRSIEELKVYIDNLFAE